MNWLLNTSIAQDIGMTLVHSLWQILLVAVLFAVANRFLSRRSAILRYVLAYAALVLMLVLPLATTFTVSVESSATLRPTEHTPQQLEHPLPNGTTGDGSDADLTVDATTLPLQAAEARHAGSTALPQPPATEAEPQFGLGWVLPWLSVAWFLGVIAFSLRPFVALYRCRRIRSRAQSITLTWIDETLDSLCKRIGLSRNVEIASSDLVLVPTVMGCIRPIILLPLSMISGQTQHELSAIIAHELAHIKRHDFVLNLLQTAIETLLFYHPAAWWVSSIVRQERENCCDDIAMAVCGRKRYATALANLEFARSSHPSLAMGADGGSLYRRIHRIARPHENPNPLGRWLAAIVAVSALLLGIMAVLSPESDVAAAADEKSKVQEVVNGGDRSSQGSPLITGRIFANETKRPVADAKLWRASVRFDTEESTLRELGVTELAANGEFEVAMRNFGDWESMPKDEWVDLGLFATAERRGFAWFFPKPAAKVTADLGLVLDDVPIQGRIVDTEGRAVPGVMVAVDTVYANDSASLSGFLESVEDKPSPIGSILRENLPRSFQLNHQPGSAAILGISNPTTDNDGRFEINGVGRERLVRISVSGANVETKSFHVATRSLASRVVSANDRGDVIHGASCTFVVSQGLMIEGVVTDRETKAPLGGVLIRNSTLNNVSGAYRPTFSATTDSNGRYKITGFPTAGVNRLMAVPTDEQPYFIRDLIVDAPTEPGSRDVVLNFGLKKGIWIEGKVTERDSGKPVMADLHYLPFMSNKHAQQLPEILGADRELDSSRFQSRYRSNSKGSFRLVGLPGRAVVAVGNAMGNYVPGMGASRIEGINEQGEFNTFRNPVQASLNNLALVEINPTPSEKEVKVNLQLVRGQQQDIRVFDADGKPVRNTLVSGLRPEAGFYPTVQSQSTMKVVGLGTDESRTVLIQHHKRGLAAKASVQAGQTAALSIVLRKGATVRGRLVDENSDPVQTNVEATTTLIRNNVKIAETTSEGNGDFILGPMPPDLMVEFRLPNAKYRLPERARQRETTLDGTIDLGTLVVTGSGSTVALVKQADQAKPSGATTKASKLMPLTYSGTVTNQDGAPIAGAHVAVIARELDGQVWRDAKSLAETTSDGDGSFLLRLEGVTEKTHANAHLVMRTDESGIAWRKLDLKRSEQPSAVLDVGKTKLPPSEPIQCRLIDLEGQPAKNLEVQVAAIVVPANDEQREWLRFFSLKQPPKAWARSMRTDDDGLLTVRNVARGHGVYLSVLASDEFAPQHIALNTGMAEKRGERDGTYRNIVKNMQPGEVASIPLSPATVFEGVVRLAGSDRPAANSKIEIWARQENSGSMYSVFDTTDSEGRFRLNPHPGVRFGITAHPPEGSAYQIRRLGGMEGIRWKPGSESKNITIELSRGVVATGRIVDDTSGQPIANASVEYRPMATNANDRDAVITGWQGIKKTNEQGEFSIAVLPGEGWLLVHSNSRDYVLQEKAGRQLEYEKPGGMRIYAHAFVKINPTPKKDKANVGQVKLTAAKSVTLEVVDPDGNPVDEGLAISRLHVIVHAGWWRGQTPDVIKDGKVEIGGIGEGVEYPIYLLDPKRKLGATVRVNSQMSTQKITLQPCGAASMRYVNQHGDPLAGKGMEFHMVVTPGVNLFDQAAMRSEGAVAADRDFVANIDRLNHWGNRSKEDGRLVISALIPGATYRHASGQKDKLNEFVAKSGEVHKLGDIVIHDDAAIAR